MGQGRIQKSFNNQIVNMIQQILSMLLNFVVRTMFIKYLGASYLGLNGLFGNILSLLSLAEMGLGSAIVFQMYRTVAVGDKEKTKQYLHFFKIVYRIIGFAVFLIGLGFMPFLKLIIKGEVGNINIYLVYFLYLVNTCSSYWLYAYRGSLVSANQEGYKLKFYNFFNTIIVAIVQILFLVMFREIYLYLFTPIVLGIIFAFVKGIKIGKLYPYIKEPLVGKLEKFEVKIIKKNVFALLLHKISTTIVNSADNIILSSFVGIIIVGLYSNYSMIISLVGGFVLTLFSSITAGIGNLNATATVEKKYKIFKTLSFANFWIYGFCSICLFVLFTPFIDLWIGNEYALNLITEMIIVGLFLYSGLGQTIWAHRDATGLYYQGRYRPIFSAILNIAISIPLVIFLMPYNLAVAGVLGGTWLSSLVTTWWYDARLVHRKLFNMSPKRYYLVFWLRFLFIAALAFGLRYLCGFLDFAKWFNTNAVVGAWIDLFVSLLIIIITVNGLFLAMFWKKPEFIYLKDAIKSVLFKKKSPNSNKV